MAHRLAAGLSLSEWQSTCWWDLLGRIRSSKYLHASLSWYGDFLMTKTQDLSYCWDIADDI